jgi:malonyl-CoA O-methyltransferase
MINKKIMQKHFSRKAGTYDEYASVQKNMAEELIEMVKNQNPSEILDIGCGTGLLTQMLCEAFPKARITAVDIAPGMIEFIQKKLRAANVSFRCHDIEEIDFFSKYDLIISNATFQWFNSIGRTINKLYQSLSDKGLLCFSTFGDMTFRELRQSYAKAGNKTGIRTVSKPGQSFYSLKEMLALCRESLGDDYLGIIKGEESLICDYFPSVYEFLNSIRKIGANNSNLGNRTSNPSVIKSMMAIYQNEFSEKDQIKATYHCLYVAIERLNRRR